MAIGWRPEIDAFSYSTTYLGACGPTSTLLGNQDNLHPAAQQVGVDTRPYHCL